MRGIALTPDEKSLAVSMPGKVELWSLEPWELQGEFVVGTPAVNGMVFSPDGRWFAVGAADKKIRVWNLS